ncbi:MAG: hypothetical protein H6720_26335 [Sandaracinus sp.]|nr:hypothetical protein [Sandaracinus sp.]
MPDRDPDDAEIPADSTAAADDNSSVPITPTRRSGEGPYRDAREVLLARRRRTRRRLEEAERAAGRVDELREELEYVDASLRSTSSGLLAQVRITTPCRERWDAMVGDDVVRHCARCGKDVYDLSTMRTSEAEALLARDGTCVRLRRRRDGRVVTSDCPSSSRHGLQIAGAMTLAAATAALATHAHATLTRPLRPASGATVTVVDTPRPFRHADPHRVLDGNLFVDVKDEDFEVTMGQPLALPSFGVDQRALTEAWPSDTRLLPVEARDGTLKVAVYGVHEGSVLASMGLRDGDALRSISGLALRGLDDLLLGFEILSKHGGGVVVFEREGTTAAHVIELRDPA